ncbi:carboxymuconolactone decarboxylase family protein [Nocardioides alcanivorans]|uniref:carboxymuconolactone decarboxylase family protein n=1 Tax=Nocardioides alcanivorans TaxID=2897352 RepID=UPI001F43B8D9|nr:hypothetical protein [Nocardioides alcanivorans]
MTRIARTVLAQWAPTMVQPWDDLVAQAGEGGVTDLVRLLRPVCAAANGLTPLPVPPGEAVVAASHSAVVEFAEQFCVDVSSIDDAQRARLHAAVGDAMGDVVAATWVADMVPRVAHTLARLFPDTEAPADAPAGSEEITWRTRGNLVGDVVKRVTPTVGALKEVDPVTTEVVRLRGAAAHNCRLCKSLRDTTALEAGADSSVLEQLATDPRAAAALDAPHRAAVALVDAIVWAPAHLSDEVIADLRRHYTAAEQVEMVLDVARNGVNKIMVALGRDEARVDEGVEFYHVGDDGIPVFADA